MIRAGTGMSVALLGVTLVAGAARADGNADVREWLDRMNHALSNLDYQGTLVYQHDNRLETIRIVHIVNENGSHERLTSLNGAPREVVRTQDTVTCILPDDQSLILDRRLTTNLFPSLPLSQASDLESHYTFRLGGMDRVAGLAVRVVSIAPRDAYRYGYRLWLEHETGMLLRSELLDSAGKAIEQVMFTDINLGEHIPMSALQPQFATPDFGPRPPAPKEMPESIASGETSGDGGRRDLAWTAAGLPPGFHLKSHDWERLSEDTSPAEHLVFTDGLASVSVYVEEEGARAGPAPPGGSRMGAISAFSREHNGHHITVVGEVPPVTVRNIARRVHPRGSPVAASD